MRTEHTEKTITNTQDAALGYWNEESGEWVRINSDSIDETAKLLKMSSELLSALLSSFEGLQENVNDLITIWERLNVLEERLDKCR